MQNIDTTGNPYSSPAAGVASSSPGAQPAHKRLFAMLMRHVQDPLHRSTYLLTANLTVTLVSGVLFWIVASHVLTAAQVGTATAFIAPTTFLTMAFLLGANHGVLRFAREIESDPRLLFALIWISAIASGLGGLVGAALLTVTGLIRPAAGSLLASMLLYALLVASGTVWSVCEAAFIALRAPGKMLVRNLGLGVVRISLLVPFIALGEWGLVTAFAIGMVLASSLSIFLIVNHMGASWRALATLRHPGIKRMMSFSLPNHLANLLASVPLIALPLIVLNVLGAEVNGYFYVAWTVSAALRSLLTAASATLLAEGARDHSRVGGRMGQSMLFLAGAVSAAAIPMVILPQLFLFPFGSAYVSSNMLALPLLALSMLPPVLTTVFVARERIRQRVKWILLLSALSGVLGAGMPYLGAVSGGYSGFVAWYLASQCLIGLMVVPSLLAGRQLRSTKDGRGRKAESHSLLTTDN